MSDERVKIRYSFIRIFMSFFLLFTLPLCLQEILLGTYSQIYNALRQIGFPVWNIFAAVLWSLLGIAFLSLAVMWFHGFSITPKGLKSSILGRVMKWNSTRKMFRLWPFPIYMVSPSFFSFWDITFLHTFFMKNKDEFHAALRKYAPEGHVMRRKFLSEAGDER